MKLALKLILILLVLLAVLYAAAPLWLSYVIGGQLPPGWQLVELKSAYPRLSGIKVDSITVKGSLGFTDLTLTATDLNLVFQGLETHVDKDSVDILVKANESASG
ncbi:MAG: hypothetical protein WBS20_01475, partial [Lysobacterales bacterium]